MNKLKKYTQFINENNERVDSTQELYDKFSDFPYAADAVAYYIFGSKSDDNILRKAFKGVYGRNTEVDSSVVSEYMLNYEYSWEENMEDIEKFIKTLPTQDGGILSDYY